MRDIERDPIVRRAIDELQKLPATDEAAVQRLVAAAAAARVAPASDEPTLQEPARRGARRWMIAGVAAAAAIAGFAVSSLRQPSRAATVAAAGPSAPSTSTSSDLQPVTNSAADVLPVARQFVFRSRAAHSVSLVGDFNRWSPASARMTRVGGGDLWSITIPVTPGRHMYGFMVDDSVFALDPRAPTARDPDLGAQGSVVVVGKP